MGLADRITLYRRMEQARGRALIVYVTSSRPNAHASMEADVVPEVTTQLECLPPGTQELDLLIVSDGGDPTVAWRIVSLIRERVKRLAVLIPHAAFSAATLIALGADEIIMHPNGNLGPTDPQIFNHKKQVAFGSEDMSAFLNFAKSDVGLTDQSALTELFKHFCREVGFAAIGVAARSSQLAGAMAEKLLSLHMKDEAQREKAKAIAEALNKKYFHHGYPLSRSEAKDIGLAVAESNAEIQDLMWRIWKDLEEDLKLREPFLPIRVLRDNPQSAAALFAPVPQAILPAGLPAAMYQQWLQGYLQQHGLVMVPPARYRLIQAVVESARCLSQFIQAGEIFAARQPDLQIRVSSVVDQNGWVDVPIPAQPQDVGQQVPAGPNP